MFVLVLDKPLGDNAVGDILHIEDETAAESLISAGIAHEATEEDLHGGEDEVVEETPAVVTASVRGVQKKAENAIVKATEKAVKAIVAKMPRPSAPNVSVPAEAIDRKKGFKSLGDFAKCVQAAECGDTSARRKLTNISNEGTSGDGGALVPIEFSQTLFEKIWNQRNLLAECFRYPISGNNIKVAAQNETQASQGVVANWIDEEDPITDSKLKVTQIELQLKKLACLVPVTEELLNDNAYALAAHLEGYVPKKMVFKLNDGILNGTGSQANLIGGASTVVVARRHGGHINYKDITTMYTRLWSDSEMNAAWYINPSVYGELLRMAFPDFSGGVPAFMPTNGVAYPSIAFAPSGTLMGRPVYKIENMAALGTQGDIMLADMTQCGCAYKEAESAFSSHLYFDRYISAFRYVMRVATKSLWTAPYTRADSVTASPFVVLDSNGDGSQTA